MTDRDERVARVLAKQGVYAGHFGLEGLANATDFWEQQPYGTRLYYGPNATDYLHIGVLRAAIEALRAADNGSTVGTSAQVPTDSATPVCATCSFSLWVNRGNGTRVRWCLECGHYETSESL